MIQRLCVYAALAASLAVAQSVTVPTITLGGEVANMSRSSGDGTANTGVTAVETKTGQQHVTKLTFTALAVDAIAAAADEAVGKLLYTLPSGAVLVRAAYMNVALGDAGALIDADTPDVGLGTTIASGAVATLDGTAAFENIITGQTATNVNGAYITKGVTDSPLVIQSSESHLIYLNVADGWAGADAGLTATGTVIIEWVVIT